MPCHTVAAYNARRQVGTLIVLDMKLFPVVDQPKPRLDTVVSVGVFLFFALMLSVPRGYTLGATLLFFAGLYHLSTRPVMALSCEDKVLMWLLAGISALGVFSYFYHGNSIGSLDLISRYVLAVPILLLLISYPPNAKWVWAGLIVGCLSAAGLTLWQVFIMGLARATGTTGVIQFGNLGLSMGIFCAAGAIGLRKGALGKSGVWRWMLSISALAGLYVSIESGSRGGWIALPVILAVFVAAYVSRRNVKHVLATILALLVVGFVAVATIPAIEHRYNHAVSDIERYKAGDLNTSLGLRFGMYESLAILIPKKPWLGWSESDYHVEQQRLAESGEAPKEILTMANTHNTYLEVWVFHGVFCLLLLVALLVVCLIYFARRVRSQDQRVQVAAVCGATLIVGYGVFSFSQVMLSRNNTLLFFLISLAVFWAMAKPRTH